MRRRWITEVVGVCSVLVLAGCSLPRSPTAAASPKPTAGSNVPVAGARTADREQRLADAPSGVKPAAFMSSLSDSPPASFGRSLLDSASSAGRTISGKAKHFGHQVSDALALKPKVVPANDPVKLASQPTVVSAALYTQAAWYAERTGNTAGAIRHYEKALEIDPHDLPTLISYARLLDRIGKSDEALRIYQRAQTAAPRQALVWNDVGLFHARHGQPTPALDALRRAIELQPDNLRYRNNLAALLVETQRPQEALRELEKAQPSAVAHQTVGYLLYLRQDHVLAARYFAEACRIDPQLVVARQMLAQLNRERPLATQVATPPQLRSNTWATTDADPNAPPFADAAGRTQRPALQPAANPMPPGPAAPMDAPRRLPTQGEP